MSYAPIILFVYNRPEHTSRLIETLRRNQLSLQSELFIYSDGAKCEEASSKVNEVREYIHTITGFLNITIIEQEVNKGLANNIIEGVTTLLNRYDRVIVLEDDLVLSPFFLQFMNDALETYKDEPRVGHIQACDFTQDPSLPDTFLIKWTGSWGWATWQRAWQHFNQDGGALLTELKERNLTYTFDFDGKYGYTRMLDHQIKGYNNSWAIRWNASLFLKDILSLNVGKSLVENKGFDGSGTNCGSGNLYSTNLWMEPLTVEMITPVEENMQARRAYKQYYQKTNSFVAKAMRRIRRTLKGDFGK